MLEINKKNIKRKKRDESENSRIVRESVKAI